MVGIGNEQWQTEKIDFFGRYQAFEKAIHAKYPEIKLIGSAGPDITSEHYDKAWEFYKKEVPARDNFCYAVDEHYYVNPTGFMHIQISMMNIRGMSRCSPGNMLLIRSAV